MLIREILLSILSFLFSSIYLLLDWLFFKFVNFMNKEDIGSFVKLSVASCIIIGVANTQISSEVKWYLILFVCLLYCIKLSVIISTIKEIDKNLAILRYFKIDDAKDDMFFRAEICKFYISIFFSLVYFCAFLFSSIGYEQSGLENAFNFFIFFLISIGFYWAAMLLVLKFYNIIITVIIIIFSVAISYLYFEILHDFYDLLGFEYKIFSKVVDYLPITLSIVFQLMIIKVRPFYKLAVTKLAFMYSHVIFSIISLLSFIFIDDISNFFHSFKPMENQEEIRNHLSQFIRIATFPYIVGALMSSLYIEHKSIKAKVKAEKHLILIMEQLKQKDVKLLSENEKKQLQQNVKYCIFYGGEVYKVPLLCNRDIQLLFEKETNFKRN